MIRILRIQGTEAICHQITTPNLSRNYPPSRKWSLLGIVSIVTLIRYESLYTGPVNDIDCISPFASTLFAPAAGYAAQEFGTTSSILSTLAVTAYLFGYAVSLPCSFSPVSLTSLGGTSLPITT